MAWFLLIFGGLFEAGFSFCMGMMKGSTGWTWWAWLGGFLACTLVSMGCLVKASQTLPIGKAYPLWTGVGAIGSVLLGIFFFHEPATFWRMFFVFTLIASIIGLKMVS